MIQPQATVSGETSDKDGYYDIITSSGDDVSAVAILRDSFSTGQVVTVIQCGDEYGIMSQSYGQRGVLEIPSDDRFMAESSAPHSVALSSIGQWASLTRRIYLLGQVVSVGTSSLVVDLLDGPSQDQRITTVVDDLMEIEASDFKVDEKVLLRAWPDAMPTVVGWWEPAGGTLIFAQISINGSIMPEGFDPPFSKNNIYVIWYDIDSGVPPEEWPSGLVLQSYDQDLGIPTKGFNYSNFDRESWSTGGTYYDPGNITITAKGQANTKCQLLRTWSPPDGELMDKTFSAYLCMNASPGAAAFGTFAAAVLETYNSGGYKSTLAEIDLATPFVARVGYVPGEEYYDPNSFYFVFGVDEISKTGEGLKATLNLDPKVSLCSIGF